MDMLQLEIFISAAQTLNFSKTADRFRLTQPAVSYQMKTLEKQLGTELFRRDGREISLTSEGREFLPYAVKLVDTAADAESRVRNVSQGRSGRIRIAVLSSSSDRLTSCLSEFYKRYPLIQTDIDILEGAEEIEALGKPRSYDFFFSVERMIPDTGGYTYRVLAKEQMHIFVHRDLVEKIDLDDWSSMADIPFVSVPPTDVSLARMIDTICRNRGLNNLNIVSYYNRAEAVVMSVNTGVGIAILPAALGRLYQRPNVVTIPIPGEDAVTTSVAAWDNSALSPAAKKFAEMLKELF
ncbi:MAG: LysR family transcriptional regulator [Oscillospiraceae bacterium]|nr:LysR family transcriptional regulator [Oscillospiraceae bacterium]